MSVLHEISEEFGQFLPLSESSDTCRRTHGAGSGAVFSLFMPGIRGMSPGRTESLLAILQIRFPGLPPTALFLVASMLLHPGLFPEAAHCLFYSGVIIYVRTIPGSFRSGQRMFGQRVSIRKEWIRLAPFKGDYEEYHQSSRSCRNVFRSRIASRSSVALAISSTGLHRILRTVFPSRAPGNPVGPIRYRIASLALCIEHSCNSRSLYHDLAGMTGMDLTFIRSGSADWFWNQMPNTCYIRLEPERLKEEDSGLVSYEEALRIEELRGLFVTRLLEIMHRHRVRCG